MPPVVAAIVSVLGFVEGALITYGGLSAAAALGVVSAMAVGGGVMALNSVMRALAPKRPKGSGRGLDQQLYDATAGGRLLFGEVRVGGAHVIPPIVTADYDLSGTQGGMRSHRVLALALHEVDSFTTTYADQTEITNAQIASVTGAAYTDGRVTAGKFAPNGTSTTYLWIRRYAGTATQAVDYFLNHVDATAFSSDFRGRGITYAAITYGWSGSGSGYLWQTGLPDLTFVVKGMKCYDPRLDSTNGGAGTHRYATPSTWAWTANPALVAGTFLMFDQSRGGGGYDPATEIDWALIAAAATICEANVDSATGASNRDRYTCNLVLEATALFEDNLAEIIDCMLGRCVWRDGKWRTYAGAWDTATFTINESDWISPITVQTVAPRREGRWNGVRCFYVDPARNYQRVECYPRTNATYYADDASERIWLEIERAGCNTESEAQMHAEFLLRQSRNQIRLTGRLGPKFQYLALWETGVVMHEGFGWTSKTFRLASYKLNADGSVDVGLAEEQSTDWTDLAQAEYGNPSTAALPDSNVQQPGTPTTFALSETLAGTLLVNLTPGEVRPVGTTFQLYASPGTLWNTSSAQLVWEGDANNVYVPYSYGVQRWWHVRAHHGSYYSSFLPNTFGNFLMLLPKADNTLNNRVVPDAEMDVGTPAFWTFSPASDSAGNFSYVGSAVGAVGGVLRYTKTNSEGPTPWLAAYPHPNAVSSLGYPNAGTRVYWINVKFRVNSYVPKGANSYIGPTSGGFLRPDMVRVSSGNVYAQNASGVRFAPDWWGVGVQYIDLDTLYWPNLTLGVWYELEDAIVVAKANSTYPTFDYMRLYFMASDLNSGTQIDIDRMTATDVGLINVPISRGAMVSTYLGDTIKPYMLASEPQLLVGSSWFNVPDSVSWWDPGVSAYVSKPNSTAGACYLRTLSTSYFLTIVGTIAQVHTVTLRAAGAARAKVTFTGSFRYLVDGVNLS